MIAWSQIWEAANNVVFFSFPWFKKNIDSWGITLPDISWVTLKGVVYLHLHSLLQIINWHCSFTRVDSAIAPFRALKTLGPSNRIQHKNHSFRDALCGLCLKQRWRRVSGTYGMYNLCPHSIPLLQSRHPWNMGSFGVSYKRIMGFFWSHGVSIWVILSNELSCSCRWEPLSIYDEA